MKRTILFLLSLLCIVFLFLIFLKNDHPAPAIDDAKSDNRRLTSSQKNRIQTRSAVLHQIESDAHGENEKEIQETEWAPTEEQVEAYLAKHARSAESLITVFDILREKNYLDEALERFPNDPLVQFANVRHHIAKGDGSPEERQAAINKLKEVMPENALGNFVSAHEALKAGNAEAALAEIFTGVSKSGVNTFNAEMLQNREEFFLACGVSVSDAESLVFGSLILPFEAKMKSLSQQLAELQDQYVAAGDTASAEQLAALNISISKQWGNAPGVFLISEMVGSGMEQIALKNLQPDKHYDFLGKTAAERIEELKRTREERKQLVSRFTGIQSQLSAQEKAIYFQRLKLYGETKAMQWLLRTHGK